LSFVNTTGIISRIVILLDLSFVNTTGIISRIVILLDSSFVSYSRKNINVSGIGSVHILR
jgi:hypothetical protein